MSAGSRRYERAEPSFQFELGTKAVLSMFFAVAILCGLFFSFGYTLGKHAIPATFSLGTTAPSQAANKPIGGATVQAAGVAPPDTADLSAAEANQTPATLDTPTPATTAPPSAAPTTIPASAPAAAVSPVPAPAADAPGFRVQVFAGTQTDATNLAAALKARGYVVSVAAPGAGDNGLYVVQAGPYASQQAAQAMRDRLSADGYQAVLKP